MCLPALLQICIRVGLAAAMAFYFTRVLTPRHGTVRVLLVIGLLLAAFQLLYALCPTLYYLSSEAAPLVSVAVALAEAGVVIGLLRIMTSDGFAKILLFYSLALLISVLSALLPFVVMGLLGGESVMTLVASQWNDLLISFIGAVLNISLLIVAAETIGHYINRQTVELRWSQFAPVIGAQAASLLLCTVMMESKIPERERLIVVLSILVVLYAIVDAVQVWSFRAQVKNSELASENAALRNYQKLQHEHYCSMAEQMQTVRRLRHDYKNTLLTMDALIDSGETERARKLAEESSALLALVGPVYYTGNDILDAVLNGKAREAEKDGIAFSVSLTLPASLRMDDVDLMSVFANLIDNAIEFERQLSADIVRKIEVTGTVRAGLWALTFSNTYPGEELPQFTTTKTDRAGHGHGREIVRSILQKYDGTFSDQLVQGMYTVVLTLLAT